MGSGAECSLEILAPRKFLLVDSQFQGFAKYLFHGLAGTSAPKAAVLAPLAGGAAQPPRGARLIVMPPHDGKLLGSSELQLLVVADGWKPTRSRKRGRGRGEDVSES